MGVRVARATHEDRSDTPGIAQWRGVQSPGASRHCAAPRRLESPPALQLRVAWHLCSPLPTPCASTAVEFPESQGKQAWQWRSPEDFPEVLCPRETLVVEMARDAGDGTESRQATPAPALHTAQSLEDGRPVAVRPEARGLGQHCPRGGLALERLPLLLGGVTQGAATFGDLWWTQRTDEPGHSGRPVGQAD